MSLELTLEYWIDDGWFVGRLREVPGVFSQGESLEELEANIRDAYGLMVREEAGPLRPDARVKSIAVDAALSVVSSSASSWPGAAICTATEPGTTSTRIPETAGEPQCRDTPS